MYLDADYYEFVWQDDVASEKMKYLEKWNKLIFLSSLLKLSSSQPTPTKLNYCPEIKHDQSLSLVLWEKWEKKKNRSPSIL